MTGTKKLTKEGVQVTLTPKAISQGELIDRLETIRPSQRKFLKTLLEVATKQANKTPDQSITLTRSVIQYALAEKKLGSSPSMISRHLGYLEKEGVAIAERERSHNGSTAVHFHIADFFLLMNLPSITKKHTDGTAVTNRWNSKRVKEERGVLRAREDHHLLDSTDHLKILIHEKIFNGVLDSAVRLSYRDSRTKLIECTYLYQGSPLYITTSCSSEEDSEIMASPDQRVMRALNSLCRRSLQRHLQKARETLGYDVVDEWDDTAVMRSIPNLFSVDVNDLCRLMRFPENSDGEQAVVAMLRRLNDTKFSVDCRYNPAFKEMFSVSGMGDIIEFRYMQNLEITRMPKEVRSQNGVTLTLVPRFYTFSLEPRIFTSLVFNVMGRYTSLFISHPELAYERSGMVQRFYNWARSYVGSREKTNLYLVEYDLQDMHERLSPATRADNFKHNYLNMIERFVLDKPLSETNPKVTALIHGYFLHIDNSDPKKGPMTRIERDRNDPIVGDDGPHHRKLREQAALALDDLEGEYWNDQGYDSQIPLLDE
ncbi:MAG: hypothetical protein WCY88_13610 [Spongiibacteraceae bacterium]